MPELALASRQSLPAKPEPKRFRIGKKLQIAIDAIVFEGQDLQEAARTAKTSTRVLRRALERRHVLAHLKKRREVLRASARGSNISRLVQIRDAADNMPAVQAIRELERMDDSDEIAGSARRNPGVVIIVQTGPAVVPTAREQAQVIDNVEGDGS